MKQVPDQQRTYAALLVAEGSLSAGDTSQHLAHRLIDESNDILAISLDKQVCHLDKSCYVCNRGKSMAAP